ncbi:hypothetical protein JW905_14185 [bacterium]|nr:hypothetical protein [candidate division CSSED10-310 bacterium]
MSLNLVFVLPEAFALVLLIAHSVKVRGWRQTLLFFGSGFFYFTIKENLTALNLFQHGRYRFEHIQLPVFKAPLFVICGWVFAAYLALSIAEGIIARLKHERSELFLTLVLSIFITSSIAYAVEVCGVTAGWWDWPYHRGIATEEELATIIYGIYTPIYGWARFINGFLAIFLLFQRVDLRIRKSFRTPLMFLSFLCILASLLTKFYNFQLTGIIEMMIVLSSTFYVGIKLRPGTPEGKGEGWIARHGVLMAAAMMLGVCYLVAFASHAPMRTLVSTFALICFLLIYKGLIDFRLATVVVLAAYLFRYVFNAPAVSFAFIQVTLIIAVLILRKIFRAYWMLNGMVPVRRSPILFRKTLGAILVVWLIIIIGIQKGQVLKTWLPDF